MGDKSVQRDYFARMSRSMTTLCNNFATVMHSNDDYDNPPMDGIWGAVELPQLQLPKDQQYKGEVEVESVRYFLGLNWQIGYKKVDDTK